MSSLSIKYAEIARLATGWDEAPGQDVEELEREIHTLKGDASMLGLRNVPELCHQLEDLLAIVRSRGLDDELDMLIGTALHSLAMAVRLGNDFGRAVEAVIAKHHGLPRRGRMSSDAIVPIAAAGTGPTKQIAHANERLAGAAVQLLVEATAQSSSRARLKQIYGTVRDAVAPELVSVRAILAKHELGAHDLARELDKAIELEFDLDDVSATPEVGKALGVAALHLIRNAIDHGIDAAGGITVRLAGERERIVLEVIDDGRGIDRIRVQERAKQLGIENKGLLSTLLQPGFSTRASATSISGRGIGLDAVAKAIQGVGGTIALASEPGRGARWTVAVPQPARDLVVHRFMVPGCGVPIAVPVEWSIEPCDHVLEAIDLAEELGIARTSHRPPSMYRLANGDMQIDVGAIEMLPTIEARRMVVTSPSELAEIAMTDEGEVFLIRVEKLARVAGTVTILDDSEIVRELVRAALQPHGIEVVALKDPNALLGTFAANPSNRLLLDLSFRNIDLAELIFDAKLACPGLEVYLHSDRSMADLAKAVDATKADGHLSKALGTERFIAQVSRVLRGKKLRRAS